MPSRYRRACPSARWRARWCRTIHRKRSRRKVAQVAAFSVGQFTFTIPRGCWIWTQIFDDVECKLVPVSGRGNGVNAGCSSVIFCDCSLFRHAEILSPILIKLAGVSKILTQIGLRFILASKISRSLSSLLIIMFTRRGLTSISPPSVARTVSGYRSSIRSARPWL